MGNDALDDKATIDVLLELTRALNAGPELEEALKAVTDSAMALLPCEHASVRVLDDTRTALLSGARSGEGSSQGAMTFRHGEGIIGWVAEQGKPARVGDVATDARFKRGPSQGFAISSMLAVPLQASDQVVGVLGATSRLENAFTAEHEDLATLLANCAVPAIERARLERLKVRLEHLAVMDANTAAFGHRYLKPKLREELDRSRRRPAQLSVVLMDLDEFKTVNDRFGHAVGDEVLRIFADRVLSVVRSTDALIRRGGDEFVLVMPGASGARATDVGERIRERVEEEPLTAGEPVVSGTVSVGVATWDGEEDADALEARADKAMYKAKNNGRNRVVRARSGS